MRKTMLTKAWPGIGLTVLLALAVALPMAASQAKLKSPPLAEEIVQHAMDVTELRRIIEARAEQFVADDPVWNFTYGGVQMIAVSDKNADRMRIIAPIVKQADLDAAQKDAMLEANYHRALDVRYAISNGIVWTAFIHPLSPLDQAQVISALDQVRQSALTFGSSYSSTGLVFGGEAKPANEVN
ncbi:MAG: hypothetical protein AB7V26_04520 [Lysobacterales bacterium]